MNSTTILVIDDDENIRAGLRLALQMEGHQVLLAANGKEGLEVLSRAKPALILLDLMMPVMDGWTFAAELEKSPDLPHPPIIVLTAFADRAGDVKGARRVLVKPFDLPVLFAEVERWSVPA